MPDRMVWPLSWSVFNRRLGSSPASFCRPSVIFSTPSLVFGSTEMSITGTGNAMRSSTTGSSDEASVSPVWCP